MIGCFERLCIANVETYNTRLAQEPELWLRITNYRKQNDLRSQLKTNFKNRPLRQVCKPLYVTIPNATVINPI